MKILLLLFLAATAIDVSSTIKELPSKLVHQATSPPSYYGVSLKSLIPSDAAKATYQLFAIKNMIHSQAGAMNKDVVNKVMQTIQCSNKRKLKRKHILTVIDYSLPSNEKRLWVFDLKKNTLLYNTYVSHGIKSGFLDSDYFSNKHNSKASSLGVFRTDQAYYGRYGIALRLTGMESGFNDQASRRAIVMHGGWYVTEQFIKKYGRAGRSWGCPAIPIGKSKEIINTIKDNALLIAYYPSEKWLLKSRYLHCGNFSTQTASSEINSKLEEPIEMREDILFVEKNNNNTREEHEPIIVMSADNYIHTFKTSAPLKRMLRRQIDKKEYIALNSNEFKDILNVSPDNLQLKKTSLKDIFFVIPHVKRHRGRYLGTIMKIISLGQIKKVTVNDERVPGLLEPSTYTVHFINKPSRQLKTTGQFIRWLGL